MSCLKIVLINKCGLHVDTLLRQPITCGYLLFSANVILINRKKNFMQKMEFIKKSESKAYLLKSILQFAM